MIKFFIHWLALTLIVIALPFIVKGISDTVIAAVFVALLLLIINMFIKPIISLITLPINLVTFGIFSLVLNGFFLWILTTLVPNFHIALFWEACVGAVIISLLNAVASFFIE